MVCSDHTRDKFAAQRRSKSVRGNSPRGPDRSRDTLLTVAGGSAALGAPDVVIRDCAADNGTEPNTQCTTFSNSPDIWVRPAQDGSLSPWCPTAGFNAWVYVRVTNIGPDQLNDGEVHVYYGEASTSLGNWPGNWVNNAPHGDEIGFAPVNGLVGNGGTTIVAIPWPNVPANSGTDHFCLVARFVSPVGSGNVTVGFTLPAAGPVTLAVYDLNGRLVRTLLSGSNMSGGAGEVVWDGRSDAGQPVTSGTYFTRLSAERTSVERQIKIVR